MLQQEPIGIRAAEEVGDVKHLVPHNDPAILVGVVLGNLLCADWHGQNVKRADGGSKETETLKGLWAKRKQQGLKQREFHAIRMIFDVDANGFSGRQSQKMRSS